MRLRTFVHKGFKKLYADDAGKGVPPDTVDKLRKMLAFLEGMAGPEEVRMLPSWKAHALTGDRKGVWSLGVTANRRLTLRSDTAEREIYGVNLEDYHWATGEKTMPIKNPPHPGDFIRTEIIEAAGLTVTAAAIALRVSRPALSSLLNGKADLSGNIWRSASRKLLE